MKIIFFILLAFVAELLIAQNDPKRGEPVSIEIDRNLVGNSDESNVIYPGCSAQAANPVSSSCLTNMLNRDINRIIATKNRDLPCKTINATLDIHFDEKGRASLISAKGEEIDYIAEMILKDAVSKLNELPQAYGDKIIPAQVNGKPVSVNYHIPFTYRGNVYYKYETFEVDGKTYNVFRQCNDFHIKEENGLKRLDLLIGEEQYRIYKQGLIKNAQNKGVNKPINAENEIKKKNRSISSVSAL